MRTHPLFGALLLLPQGAAPTWSLTDGRAAAWSADVQLLARELPKLHKNLFFQLDKAAWEKGAEALDADIPKLTNEEALVRLMQLVASVGDGHTAVQIGRLAPPLHALPVRFLWFDDGVFCVASSEAAMVGGKLTKIETTPVERAFDAIASAIPLENESAKRRFVPDYAAFGEILKGLGLAPRSEAVRYTVVTPGGTEKEFTLTAIAPGSRPVLHDWLAISKQEPPLRMRKREPYWFESLEKEAAVYIQYNQCAENPKQPFATFAKDALALVDSSGAKTVVVDLRNNGGGDSRVAEPLLEGLEARKSKVRIAVLVSRATLSSAVLNAEALRSRCGAAVVGEPYGQRAAHFGEMKILTLPKTGISVSYSTKFFPHGDGTEASGAPTIRVGITSTEYFAGKDPMLEAALRGR